MITQAKLRYQPKETAHKFLYAINAQMYLCYDLLYDIPGKKCQVITECAYVIAFLINVLDYLLFFMYIWD